MIIINPYRFTSAASTLLTGLTASYSLNGNALKNVGSNDGTATNVTWGTGQFGQCGIFNGTGYISVTNSSDFNLGSGDWSFSVLVKRSLLNSRQLILGTCNAGALNTDVGFFLEFNVDNNIRYLYYITNTSTLAIIDFSYQITDTNWHNLIVLRAGNRLKLYVDGTLVYNAIVFNPGDTIQFPTSTFSLGRAGDVNALLYNGSIDEFNLWNGREITLSEVTELQTKPYPFI